ncbi:LuxR family transcriptional regulator, csgAB operon transcriptional regulatory protein [Franzmannia pantelleriensis]|uniref:LuxR family transcriptional regulator, csgAB operon transcriptional regulatory protein n=1 Tax=Franzmannia pantelleriensis TaxID=48727 RepID=A0A1G9EJW4_9GAMM|nr:LuxR C-terminal-related transcriptional regulator [Halomonas pantelleriensis]SDK76477.1 LuxR family transcriptional regulator, csgAB operon transcriptional regulatory protein [Halomonas pantelleriensis]
MNKINNTVVLVTNPNPQSHIFVDYMAEQLGCHTDIMLPSDDLYQHTADRCVLLIDIDHVPDPLVHDWYAMAVNSQRYMVAIINLKDEEHAMDVIKSLHAHGVFYRNSSSSSICKGVQLLLDGDFWMSRQLMANVIDYYRQRRVSTARPPCGLTHREMEIMSLVARGYINSVIANKLCITECTVKSHIYNIFKKIKVSNRMQAVNWANDNLIPTMILRGRNDNMEYGESLR